MKNVFYYDFPIGPLGIVEENGAITRVFFPTDKDPTGLDLDPLGFEKAETPLIRKAASQLDEYFKAARKEFDLPLLLHGTDFQQAVWNTLLTIPFGQTRSYMDIAAQIGNPRACRAVGMANNRNPIVIIVPCHRVIGRDGGLTGYGGGLNAKQYLLELENEGKS
jgi:methylated-DNA-[protein]-cysteine S-methyltransferase